MGRRRGPRQPHVPGPQRHLVNVLRTAQVVARIVTETLSESSPHRHLPTPNTRGLARPFGRFVGPRAPPCGPNHGPTRPWWAHCNRPPFPPGQGGRPTTQHNGQRFLRRRERGRARAYDTSNTGRSRLYQSYTVTIDNPNCRPSASSLTQSPRVTSGPQTSTHLDQNTKACAENIDKSKPTILEEEDEQALLDPSD